MIELIYRRGLYGLVGNCRIAMRRSVLRFLLVDEGLVWTHDILLAGGIETFLRPSSSGKKFFNRL